MSDIRWNLGRTISNVGTKLGLPEFGLSEKIGGGNQTYDYTSPDGNQAPKTGGMTDYPVNNTPYGPEQPANQPTNQPADQAPAGDNPLAGFNLEDERAYYGDKISTIDRLLGRVGTTQEAGIRNLNDSYNYQKGLTTKRYTDQSNENSSDKERGINQTDNFVNTSYNSLMRLLGGAGAGNSSVARTVVPTLVSKAGSARRTNVFDIFGKNQRDLDTANEENIHSLDNWKGEQEQKFNTDAENERLRLLQEKQGYEINKNRLTNPEFQKSLVDSGQVNTGYAAAKAAGTATQNDIDTRLSNIDRLLGSYSPKYTAGLKTPELSKYTMGSAPIVPGGNQPMETSYYLPQLKKRQELNY